MPADEVKKQFKIGAERLRRIWEEDKMTAVLPRKEQVLPVPTIRNFYDRLGGLEDAIAEQSGILGWIARGLREKDINLEGDIGEMEAAVMKMLESHEKEKPVMQQIAEGIEVIRGLMYLVPVAAVLWKLYEAGRPVMSKMKQEVPEGRATRANQG